MKSPYVQNTVDTTPLQLTTKNRDSILTVANTVAVTVVLPPSADMVGYRITVKKTTAAGGGSAVTVDGYGAELIDGAASTAAIDAQYDTKTFQSDGTGWHIVRSMIAP